MFLFFLIISQGVAKLKHPCTHRPFIPESGGKNILTCPLYLHSVLSHSVSPCPIVLSHFASPSIHLSPPSYILHSLTPSRTKKHLFALKKLHPCTKTDTIPLALPFFHSGDEIFKQHFCSYLIACQHTLHKGSNWSQGLGSKSSVSLGSVMFHKTQPRLERDGLSVRMLSVGMSVATTP